MKIQKAPLLPPDRLPQAPLQPKTQPPKEGQGGQIAVDDASLQAMKALLCKEPL